MGSALGLMLPSAAVLEAGRFPRDKACGEGLLPSGARRLRLAGVDLGQEGFPTLTGIRYKLPGGASAEARFAQGVGYGVRRLRLDALLGERARAQCGVRVIGVRPLPSGVLVETDHGTLRGSALVAADGLHSPIARSLGWARPPRGRRRYGIVGHLADDWPGHSVEVTLLGRVETYLAPVGGGEVLVAVLGEKRDLRPAGASLEDAYRGLLERAHPRLASAPLTGRLRGAGPFNRRPSRVAEGRIFLVGDAAGFLDPLTGDAICAGLAQAEVLAGLLRGDLDQAASRYRRWFAGHWRQRWLMSALARRLSGSPRVSRRALLGVGRREGALRALLEVADGSRSLGTLGVRDWAALAGIGRR